MLRQDAHPSPIDMAFAGNIVRAAGLPPGLRVDDTWGALTLGGASPATIALAAIGCATVCSHSRSVGSTFSRTATEAGGRDVSCDESVEGIGLGEKSVTSESKSKSETLVIARADARSSTLISNIIVDSIGLARSHCSACDPYIRPFRPTRRPSRKSR